MTRSVSPRARLRGAHLSTPAEQNKVLKIPSFQQNAHAGGGRRISNPGLLLPVQASLLAAIATVL